MIIAPVITFIGVGTVPLFVSSVIDVDRILNYPVLGYFLTNIGITTPQELAFAGSPGVGKTTLVDLIIGLLIPQKGSITVDGKDVFSNLYAWQRNIGYIPQFINLLDDTIRRNICFGIPDDEVDEEMLQIAIEIAQLQEFILVPGLTIKVDLMLNYKPGGRQPRNLHLSLNHEYPEGRLCQRNSYFRVAAVAHKTPHSVQD